MFSLLALRRRAKIEQLRQAIHDYILSIDTLPDELLHPLSEGCKDALKSFIGLTTSFAFRSEERAKSFIADLLPGRRHHDIHMVGCIESFPVLIGLDKDQFANLLSHLEAPLKQEFPHSPWILLPNEIAPYCSIRMKVFMFLFRMKNGCSFAFMEGLFGWCKSVLQHQFERILHIAFVYLHPFHQGILQYMDYHHNFQAKSISSWNIHHTLENNFQDFKNRLVELNVDANLQGYGDIMNENIFMGSIGAVDGTYSVRPRIGRDVLQRHGEDANADRMYSEYVKQHAHKLVIATSHGLCNFPKLILAVEMGSGAASDASVFELLHDRLLPHLDQHAALLGDNAYHRCKRCIVPYNAIDMVNYADNMDCRHFNHTLSSDRMASEHGVGYMKYWGVIRGRDDIVLFEKDELFKEAVYVAQALHNFKALLGPN